MNLPSLHIGVLRQTILAQHERDYNALILIMGSLNELDSICCRTAEFYATTGRICAHLDDLIQQHLSLAESLKSTREGVID